jgi:hypothetical protein
MDVFQAVTSAYPGGPANTYSYSYTFAGPTTAGSNLRHGVLPGPGRTVGGQTGVSWNSGGTALSGTWRSMGTTYNATSFNPCTGTSFAFWEDGLWVRVS